MTNAEIDLKMCQLVKTERKITREILELIVMAERQRLPEERGFKNTYDWLIRGHGYSGPAANRRVQAARLLREIPEVAAKVEEGKVNLTTLWQTQKSVKAQQKASGRKVTAEEKRQAVLQIDSKTCDAAERELNTLFPDADKSEQKIIQKRNGGLGLTVEFDADERREVERAKELLSHAMPGASFSQIIVRLAKEFNDRRDPLRKTNNAMTRGGVATTPRRAIGEAIRRIVMQKHEGRCCYKDPLTGRICGSTHQVEIDHIMPKAMGGTDEPENLRVLCKLHNLRMAEKKLGQRFMSRFRR